MYVGIEPNKRPWILQAALATSVVVHLLFGAGGLELARRPSVRSYHVPFISEGNMISPTPTPPPPEPTPAATPKPTPPPPPSELPPPNREVKETENAEPPKPVFGVTEESVVADSDFSVRVGNTLMKAQEKEFTDPSMVKPYAAPPKRSAVKTSAPPKLLKMVPPEYPALAKKSGTEGRVIVKIQISADGHVVNATVVRAEPPGMGFEQAALEAVTQWHYSPPAEGTAVWWHQPIKFTLES